MNYMFIAADTLQKVIVLVVLTIWSKISSRGSLEWSITLFSLSTQANTLVMGIPLLNGMYGEVSGSLIIQIFVLQSIIWFTLLLFLFEYRGARMLIADQFPDTGGSNIIYFKVDPGIISLEGKEPLETQAEVGEDRKLHVTVRKSTSSLSEVFSRRSGGTNLGVSVTPRPSNLTNVEIYSLPSSRNSTPRGSSFSCADFYSMVNEKNVYLSTRQSNIGSFGSDEESGRVSGVYGQETAVYPVRANAGIFSPPTGSDAKKKANGTESGKDTSASPVSEGGIHVSKGEDYGYELRAEAHPKGYDDFGREEFTVGKKQKSNGSDREAPVLPRLSSSAIAQETKVAAVPPARVITRLILIMVWRKLSRNPNIYSSLFGLTWSLISFRLDVEMPAIIAESISILSNTSLGMAMFSLGLFLALQPRIIACGKTNAALSIAMRFITGPAVMAAASIAVGLRGPVLHIAIVQAALPQAIVPFVYAKEYNVHPDIQSTGLIFGTLLALPISLAYYILLGL